MPVSTTIKVEGVKDAIKELGRIDPALRKQFNRDAAAVVDPVIRDARSSYPLLPLSGMARAWTDASGRKILPWDIRVVRRGVRFKVDTSRKRVNTIYVQQASQAGSVFEGAGRRSYDQFARALGSLRAEDTRVLGPALRRRQYEVTRGITKLVNDVMFRTNRKLI